MRSTFFEERASRPSPTRRGLEGASHLVESDSLPSLRGFELCARSLETVGWFVAQAWEMERVRNWGCSTIRYWRTGIILNYQILPKQNCFLWTRCRLCAWELQHQIVPVWVSEFYLEKQKNQELEKELSATSQNNEFIYTKRSAGSGNEGKLTLSVRID